MTPRALVATSAGTATHASAHRADLRDMNGAAIELACRIALGETTCHDRFRFAWRLAQHKSKSLAEFARQLGVHPSSLTRTNFKLSAARRREAAIQLGTPPGFLGADAVTARDLPWLLHAPHQVATAILALAKRPGHSRGASWTQETALIDLRPNTLKATLTDHPPQLVRAVHRFLAEHAARRLEHITAVSLPLGDWSAIIDLLVAGSLADAPGDIQHQRLQLACKLHGCLTDGGRP